VVVDDDEPSLPVPWGDDVATYYGVDLREVALHGTRFQRPPAQEWRCNNTTRCCWGWCWSAPPERS
jgi:hypothetical protein